MNFINYLSYIGVKEEYDDSLKRKIIIGNRLAIFLLILATIYTIFNLAKGLDVFVIPLSGIPFCVSIFLLNYKGLQKLARLIGSIVPMLVAVLYHAAMMQPDGIPITASYIFSIAFLVIPFILFGIEERIELIASLICCTVLILSVRYLNDYIDIPADNAYMRTARYEFIIILADAIIISTVLLILLQTNRDAEKNNQKLIEEIEAQNQSLLVSQAELKSFVADAERNKELERQRSWAANTTSEFTNIFRGRDGLQVMCDTFLSKLVKSISASQAAIYLLKEDEASKNMSSQGVLYGVSCYAYERKRFFETEFLVGEGLIGQSFFEQETIYITEIPEDYFEIVSGLGQATPKALLIVPLIANEQPMGVLEVASFYEIEDYQKEFVEHVGDSMASAIFNIQNSERMQALLEEVQQLNKNYQAQEKNLQQEIEHLRAENKVLEIKKAELVKEVLKQKEARLR